MASKAAWMYRNGVRLVSKIAIVAGAPAFLGACVALLGIDDLEKVDGDGAADVRPGETGAATDGGGEDTRDGAIPRGMAQVDAAPPFFIDVTEVTWTTYLAFVAAAPAKDRSVPGATLPCNPDHTPSVVPPPVADQAVMPVVGVDWCDARDYCQYAKKRLCRRIDKTQPISGSPVGNELHAACAFPAAPPPSACFQSDGGVAPVASRPSCVGGATGVYDLLGNVEEWADGIYQSTYAPVFGGFTAGPPFACDTAHGAVPDARSATLGFRCCADAPP